MDLSDLGKIADEQDAGRWFELTNPVDGSPTGIKLKIAGPDSRRQHEASLRYADALAKARDRRGRIDAARADQLYLENLADFVIDLEATEAGEKVPFSKETVLRILNAGRWVRVQVEAFAEQRSA